MTDNPRPYIECLPAQEAAYWEARHQGMGLNDRQIGDLLRAAAPHLTSDDEPLRRAADALAGAVERAIEPGRTRTHAMKSLPAALDRYRRAVRG